MKNLMLIATLLALPLPVVADGLSFRRPSITPAPTKLAYEAQTAVRLTDGIKVSVRCSDDAASPWVAEKFAAWFGAKPDVRRGSAPATGISDADGAYRLSAKPDEITIAAKSLQGVRYAMYTLRQTAERESTGAKLVGYWLPAMEVEDAPALGFRGIHFCWFPELSKTFIEHQIRMAAYYKFNYVVLESWGVFRSERHPELCVADAPLTVAEAGRLAALAKDLGVTLVPQVNIYGHAAMSRSCGGKHVALDVHPEMQPLFEPAGGWNWCLSNPEAKAVLRDFVDEVHAAFGRPPYFHIGCDEADPPSCPTCRGADSYAALVARHITEVCELLRSRGARAMMWHDMLLQKGDARWKGFYANGSAEEVKMLGMLPKDVIICDWFYGSVPKEGGYPSLDYFSGLGFDTVSCPWGNTDGIREQGKYVREHRLFGFLDTVWHHFRGQKFADLMTAASKAAWGEGGEAAKTWATPFAVHWRQIGWDMGIKDRREHGYYDEDVTRNILDR